MKKSFEYLQELVLVRNESNTLFTQEDPITNRVKYINNELTKLNIPFNHHIFNDINRLYYRQSGDHSKLVNIEVNFYSPIPDTETIIFIAHHDINNQDSQNAQDNSASICNLLELCSILSNDKYLKRNVSIVFTDKEEFGGLGAGQLGLNIKNGKFGMVEYVINLELTGLGKNIWADGLYFKDAKTPLHYHLESAIGIDKVNYVYTPFNDSIILRGLGINSVCIGILPDDEIINDKKPTWRLCHQMEDTIDKCNAEDMELFVDLLMKLI